MWPASDAFIHSTTSRMAIDNIDFVVRSGRAVLHPIFERTFGRGLRASQDEPDSSIAHRDQSVRWAHEMRRSVDFIATRHDLDTTRIAYVGTSWGGRIAGLMLAIEPRFRTAVLNVPGMTMSPLRPEEDPLNFLPRIKMPVLMLSGKFDSVFPFELSQKPFYRLLGTPPANKKHVVYDGGHFLPRPMMMQETLAWMDTYMGAVSR
jgi:pimeloyl-ACP methyl ester carboxylesterase